MTSELLLILNRRDSRHSGAAPRTLPRRGSGYVLSDGMAQPAMQEHTKPTAEARMRDRMLAGFILCGLVATAACSSGTSSSAAPGCKASQASQVTLAVGGYASFDPSADAGCATFPANASSIDSAEYLVVPHSTGGNPGGSAAFTLTDITPSPAGPGPLAANHVAFGSAGPVVPVPVAMRFDQYLRGVGRTQPLPSRTALAPQLAAGAAPAATPPTVGSKRSFAVCSNLQCTKFAMVGAKAQAVGAHV